MLETLQTFIIFKYPFFFVFSRFLVEFRFVVGFGSDIYIFLGLWKIKPNKTFLIRFSLMQSDYIKIGITFDLF